MEVDKDDGYVLVARLAAGEAASVARARLRTVASARLRERGALSAVAMELDRSGWIFLVGAGGGEGRRGRRWGRETRGGDGLGWDGIGEGEGRGRERAGRVGSGLGGLGGGGLGGASGGGGRGVVGAATVGGGGWKGRVDLDRRRHRCVGSTRVGVSKR